MVGPVFGAGEEAGPLLVGQHLVDRVDGGVGFVTLNRPKAINSLTHTMVTVMTRVLTDWADDAAVRAVVVTGAGERGLCVGGVLVPLAAVAATLWLSAQGGWAQVAGAVAVLLLGLALRGALRRGVA